MTGIASRRARRFPAKRRLCCGEAGDRDAERGARDVVETRLFAEGDRDRIAAVLAADAELGVRYVLEGSVQRASARVRVNAQLIDTETGAHLWADRFQEEIADLFKLQDDVVARLANALSYELINAEAETAARSTNPNSIDLVMRGHAASFQWVRQPPTKDQIVATRSLFERALEIDPKSADALAGSALTYMLEYVYGLNDPETDYDAKVIGQADRATAIALGRTAQKAFI
jgi:hypothetical protein